MRQFVRTAVNEGRCQPGKRLTRLNETMEDPEALAGLKLDLCIMNSVGRPLYQGTYMLEGDGPLIIIAHDVFTYLQTLFQNCIPDLSFSGVQEAIAECIAVRRRLKDDPTTPRLNDKTHEEIEEEVWAYARGVIQPANDYLTVTIVEKLQVTLHLFRVATLINPFFVKHHHPLRHVYDDLITTLGFFDAESVNAMLAEVDTYDVLVQTLPATPHALPMDDVDTNIAVIKDHCKTIMDGTIAFWLKYKEKIPHLYSLCHYLITFPPSSAAVERLFSMLQNSFGNKQTGSLEDYVELSLMYQFNDR